MTKTIKIPISVHKELKIYIANNEGERMEDFSGLAIMELLKARGHKFTLKNFIKKAVKGKL